MSALLALPSPFGHALRFSRYLSRQCDARPELTEALTATLSRRLDATQMQAWLDRPAEGWSDDEALKRALRQLRQRAYAHLALRDLAGLAALDEVTDGMSLLADLSTAAAERHLRAALVARHGEPRGPDGRVQPFICIGMGKLGGRELNVSSDVDYIFVYPEDGETDGERSLSNFEFFTRLGRKIIEALAEVTADGFVFRVDMRLRPYGDSGPLVASFDMLENYFVTQGREWERYAWIKARAMTGERHDELDALRLPFVFRKYLDFGAINAMRDLHAQIRREVARRDRSDNVKLGPGGIREIEFIAQVFQLIRGGREPELQIRPTLQVLARLAQRGVVSCDTVMELELAYVFLRRLEHRLQYLEDAQTHDLPRSDEDRLLIAQAMGFTDYAALLIELDSHRQRVSRHFDAIFGAQNGEKNSHAAVWQDIEHVESAAETLSQAGYADGAAVAHRLHAYKRSSRYTQLPESSRLRADRLVPLLIEQSLETESADTTLQRSLDLLEAISRRAAYLALLSEYPDALRQVCRLVGASSWAAGYLTQHPILLDELLDGRLLEDEPDWIGFETQLAHRVETLEPDTERQMDLMRDAHHAQVFRLLAKDLSGLLSVERLSDHLSVLGDIMLRIALAAAWKKLRNRHREQPRFAVVAYGKLGGKELGYASDLDIVFLYEDDAPEAAENYARLAQRLITWMASRTSAGILFETDTRLRPNGESGLLVSSIEAFREYQVQSAWVWEHQALSRARFCAGDTTVGAAFEQIRNEVLRRPRDLSTLRGEVLSMRQKMYDSHAGKSALFDIKHDPGGLIDVEFAVQYLVLAHSARHAALTANVGNIALLHRAAELDLLPADVAAAAADAYRELRHRQHALRLNDAPKMRVEPASARTEREAIIALWTAVFGL